MYFSPKNKKLKEFLTHCPDKLLDFVTLFPTYLYPK